MRFSKKARQEVLRKLIEKKSGMTFVPGKAYIQYLGMRGLKPALENVKKFTRYNPSEPKQVIFLVASISSILNELISMLQDEITVEELGSNLVEIGNRIKRLNPN